jgi:hypothetical protein
MEAARGEFDKVLEINPDHLRARYLRGGLLYEMGRKEAEVDFSYLLDHPRLGELLRESDRTLHAFAYSSWLRLKRGETDKAILVALRGLEFARQAGNKSIQGELHYALARGYVAATRSVPERLQNAAAHLYLASNYRSKMLLSYFTNDTIFDDYRDAIELQIHELRDDRE